jgi:polyvinyl alcohol dehydrogenase (cytochrome)
LIAGQKSGVVHALDPDNQGSVVWEARVGEGGVLGGVEFGMATDGKVLYVPISDANMIRNDPTDPKSKSRDLIFVGDRRRGGGLFALDIRTGRILWRAPPILCTFDRTPCAPAQIAAATLIPGVVFSGSVDGHMRAYSTDNGRVIWDFDTERTYHAVDGIRGHGGSISGPGPVVANGVLYFNSGYGLFWKPGNMLLAFEPK